MEAELKNLRAAALDARESSLKQLDRIEKGWRLQACIGSQTRIDITEEIAARERALLALLTQLTDQHEPQNG